MHFKLLVTFVDKAQTKAVIQAARDKGARGATVITGARGEGLNETPTFLGLTLETQRNVILFLVEILEHIAEVGEFDKTPGTGIAVQIDIEDAVGVLHQAASLNEIVEENL